MIARDGRFAAFVWDAHKRDDGDGDGDGRRRAYGFAQWCHHQRSGSDLPNTVAVSFYEHLFDNWSLHRDVVPWLDPQVRKAILPLWEWRLPEAKVTELRALLSDERDERWRQLRNVAGSHR